MNRATEIRGRRTKPISRPAPFGRRAAGYPPAQRVISCVEAISYALVASSYTDWGTRLPGTHVAGHEGKFPDGVRSQ
jgi:hypothetical protein